MIRISVDRTIAAPVELVFRTISEIEGLPASNPIIKKVEFLSDQKRGVGTRFRETRELGGKEQVTELEVTEYSPNERVRMVADSHGTIWDTTFRVADANPGTHLTIDMDCTAQKLLPKILNPLFKGLFRKGVASHVDAIQSFCETQAIERPGE